MEKWATSPNVIPTEREPTPGQESTEGQADEKRVEEARTTEEEASDTSAIGQMIQEEEQPHEKTMP